MTTADLFPRAPAERVARYPADGLWDDRALADGIEAAAALRPDLLGGAPVIAERLLHAALARPGTGVTLRTLALGGAMLPRPLLELATDAFGIGIGRLTCSAAASPAASCPSSSSAGMARSPGRRPARSSAPGS